MWAALQHSGPAPTFHASSREKQMSTLNISSFI